METRSRRSPGSSGGSWGPPSFDDFVELPLPELVVEGLRFCGGGGGGGVVVADEGFGGS